MGTSVSSQHERILFETKESLSQDAAYRFVGLAAQTTRAGKPFTVALSGGSTPEMLHRILAAPPFRETVDWANVHLFFGDERCVAPDSPDSNFRMAQETLIANVPLPPANVHRIAGELPDQDEAARQYEAELKRAFNLSESELPRFDLILLGMGSDGHCASLFPHKPALHEQTRLAVATEPGLKPFVPRVTLTFSVLNNAANILFLVAGADKATTLARVLDGSPDPETFPSQSIAPKSGNLVWLLDREAAAELRR